MVFDYIFNGKFKTNPDPIIKMCALLRTKENQLKAFELNRQRFSITMSFQEFKKIAAELNRQFKANYESRIPNPGNRNPKLPQRVSREKI